jgi:hypothetical protein
MASPSSAAASAAALGDLPLLAPPPLDLHCSPSLTRFPVSQFSEAVQVLVASLADDSPRARDSALAALRDIAPL